MSGGGRSTRQWMLWAFKLQGCADCGRGYPEIPLAELHCHHLDPEQKAEWNRKSRNTGAAGGGLLEANANQQLLDELLLCKVVCADCHRERHRNGHRNGSEQLALFAGSGIAWRLGDQT